MFVCYECCVLSGRVLCDGPLTRPEESYWLWCVVVCDLETSSMRRSWPTGDCCAINKQTNIWGIFTTRYWFMGVFFLYMCYSEYVWTLPECLHFIPL